MKKSFKLFAAALLALTSFVSVQANELTVFDGTDQNMYVPIYGYYYDVVGYKSQIIYPEAQVSAMQGASITSMKFYIATEGGSLLSGGTLAVTIGTTQQNSFPSYNPTPITEGMTHVADISMTLGETEVVINFDEPWAYEGGNIVVEAKVVNKGNYENMNFYGVNTTDGTFGSLYGGNYSNYAVAFYPKTTFGYESVENLAKVDTEAIDFGQVYLDNEATQTITLKNQGQNAFTPVFSALQAPFSVEVAAAELASGESMEIPVKFAPVAVGDYNATFTIDCGAAGIFNVAISGVGAEMPAEVVVAEGTQLSESVPVNSMNFDRENSGNVSQMIYTADLLTELAGKKINSIKFKSATANKYMADGNLQLSIKAVEEDAFASATPYEDMTVIANASPVNGEIVFNFTEPYQYNGGNLAIEVLVTQNGVYGVEKFYGITKEAASYAYFWDLGYETHVYNFLPTATFGYVKEDVPAFILGDVNGDGFITIGDVTMLISMVLGGDTNAAEHPAADCNQDGNISIGDVTMLIGRTLSGSWPEV